MPKITWLPEALADIQRLHEFLLSKSPDAAAKAAGLILQGSLQLKSTPRIGRPMLDDTGRRELFMALGAGAYVIRYFEIDNRDVVIVRVWHSREFRN